MHIEFIPKQDSFKKRLINGKFLYIRFLLAGLLFGFWFFATAYSYAHQGNYQCNENNPENCPIPTEICNNGEAVGNPHCTETPTLTPKPTCEDCDEVTPSLTPEVTASPSVTPEDVHHDPSDEKFDIHGDGRSDGLCSKPPCVPQAAPNTGFSPQ